MLQENLNLTEKIRNIESQLERQKDLLTQQSNDIARILLLLDPSASSRPPARPPSKPERETTEENKTNEIQLEVEREKSSLVLPTEVSLVISGIVSNDTSSNTSKQKKQNRNSTEIIVKNKRKRAIISTKELCYSLPYFIKSKPPELENDNSDISQKRPRNGKERTVQ
jgi:hypothetical protein